MRLAAAALTFLAVAPVLVTRSGPAPRPALPGYDLLTQKDLGAPWVRVTPARVATTADPDVPKTVNAACHRNQRIMLAFRQRVEESLQLPKSSATVPASSAVFQADGGSIYEISVRAARLPGEDIDRLERSLVESPRACDGQVVPAPYGDPYGRTLNESTPAAPALGDHSVALRRVTTLGGSADWPPSGESLYLIREGNYAVLLVFQDLHASQAYKDDHLVRRALARAAERLHRLNS
ncbi:hypothetical protein ACIQM4_28560 [Streptomyces sp. NPDC091272]|uniref:hypothetical protein n=1 Tax=Streptomyces sp. NPDC091272 TaxID=3365981 RepID=UPI0038277816